MIGIKIEGVEELAKKLAERSRRAADVKPVLVGFTAAYALYVHENIEMKLAGLPRRKPSKGFYWDPQGQAGPKFLENPAREMSNSGELGRIIASVVAHGKSLTQGLLACGLRIQREAQQRVPVDTGNLKASAFTRVE